MDYAIFLHVMYNSFIFHSLRERVKRQKQIYVYYYNISKLKSKMSCTTLSDIKNVLFN